MRLIHRTRLQLGNSLANAAANGHFNPALARSRGFRRNLTVGAALASSAGRGEGGGGYV